ncbi:putative uridylate kinase [Bisporella sp. PMI_857]|nr:putative uridylate kinase [Bisporella sp. PMI_857]
MTAIFFSDEKITVVFVLGGPGAGKGTQCANPVQDYNFTHLCAGDLLRSEQERPDSDRIVPTKITAQLLVNEITNTVKDMEDGEGRFVIDGCPRAMDQVQLFEETICKSKFVLFFDCPEEEMRRRLLHRGKTSGRADDNLESIGKRFKVFVEQSMPVIDYYEERDRVVRVLANKSPEEVYKETRDKLVARMDKTY